MVRASLFLAAGLLALAAVPVPAAGPPPSRRAEAERLFAQHVQPLLQRKCLACHGDDPKKLRGELDLRTREGMLRGGASGRPALVPGQPRRSPLYLATLRAGDDKAMPPKEADRLSPGEAEQLRRWVAAGAPWPQAPRDDWGATNGVTVRTSGGLTAGWTERRYRPEDLWAYRPRQRPAVPAAAGAQGPVDAFLLDALSRRGIAGFAPEADRLTLVRRVTFDLTGLPPTPEEVEAFLADRRPDAYERLVDRLLASPHHGEQVARHWFDVTRYADTAGFSNDFERPNTWRYRDWAVRCFNQDRPFDRFLIEQLAGDELDRDDPEMLIAAGFLRMGPWEHTGMSVAAVTRQQYLDDVTNAVGVTFLAQPLRCAACHDHKFDPIPTRDYYRLQAAFATTFPAERPARLLPAENTTGFAAGRARVSAELRAVIASQEALRKKNEAAVAALLKKLQLERYDQLPAAGRPQRANVGLTFEELTQRKRDQRSRQQAEREMLRYEPYALSVYSGPDNNYRSPVLLNRVPGPKKTAPPAKVHILAGGSLEAPLDLVTPGVLSALPGPGNSGKDPWALPAATGGRRLALARWMASPDHPLTARVIVNRAWGWHFGRGLVATPSQFGKMGARPSHPELLDWLANWFVARGWSLKELHRLIVTSAAYRQSSGRPDLERIRALDARNDLLAVFRPRRLSAEELRDAMLAMSGELNREMGGPAAFPEINWEVALQPRHLMGGTAKAYQPSPTPAERNRRTLYAFRCRTLPDPALEVFNQPGSETSCECRDETLTTPQVFALFNSQGSRDRALALAVALEATARSLEDRIARAFRLAYGRAPTAAEAKLCRAHVEKMTAHHRKHPPKETRLPTSVKRQMVEEMTGQTVVWDEGLPWVKGYQRDTQAWEVGAATRGLAELCLVLFNSNELVYVR